MGEIVTGSVTLAEHVFLNPHWQGAGWPPRRARSGYYKGIWRHRSDSFVTILGYKRLL